MSECVFEYITEDGTEWIRKSVAAPANYTENGLGRLREIELMNRISHPYLGTATGLKIDPDGQIHMHLPVAERSLNDIISHPYLTTDMKLPLLYQLAVGLEFLHTHHLLHRNICPENVVIQGMTESRALWIEFGQPWRRHPIYSPPEVNANSMAGDVWGFGMIILVVVSGNINPDTTRAEEELTGVRAEYRAGIWNLLQSIFQSDPTVRPSMREVVAHPIFERARARLPMVSGELRSTPIQPAYAGDHRDLIKLMIHWLGEMYVKSKCELLFLAIDIFNRVGSQYQNRTQEDRLAVAATCVWMAAKILEDFELTMNQFLTEVQKMAPTVTSKAMVEKEREIMMELHGNVNQSKFYPLCSTNEHINLCFGHIIMNRDSGIYANTSIVEWKNIVERSGSTSSDPIPARDFTIAMLLRK